MIRAKDGTVNTATAIITFTIPCPMLENPELLGEMVKRSGAHSTDMQQPESTQDVFNRCRPYAQQWTPAAERIWAEEHPDCGSCTACSK